MGEELSACELTWRRPGAPDTNKLMCRVRQIKDDRVRLIEYLSALLTRCEISTGSKVGMNTTRVTFDELACQVVRER